MLLRPQPAFLEPCQITLPACVDLYLNAVCCLSCKREVCQAFFPLPRKQVDNTLVCLFLVYHGRKKKEEGGRYALIFRTTSPSLSASPFCSSLCFRSNFGDNRGFIGWLTGGSGRRPVRNSLLLPSPSPPPPFPYPPTTPGSQVAQSQSESHAKTKTQQQQQHVSLWLGWNDVTAGLVAGTYAFPPSIVSWERKHCATPAPPPHSKIYIILNILFLTLNSTPYFYNP